MPVLMSVASWLARQCFDSKDAPKDAQLCEEKRDRLFLLMSPAEVI